jgi:hypothetical protein
VRYAARSGAEVTLGIGGNQARTKKQYSGQSRGRSERRRGPDRGRAPEQRQRRVSRDSSNSRSGAAAPHCACALKLRALCWVLRRLRAGQRGWLARPERARAIWGSRRRQSERPRETLPPRWDADLVEKRLVQVFVTLKCMPRSRGPRGPGKRRHRRGREAFLAACKAWLGPRGGAGLQVSHNESCHAKREECDEQREEVEFHGRIHFNYPGWRR